MVVFISGPKPLPCSLLTPNQRIIVLLFCIIYVIWRDCKLVFWNCSQKIIFFYKIFMNDARSCFTFGSCSEILICVVPTSRRLHVSLRIRSYSRRFLNPTGRLKIQFLFQGRFKKKVGIIGWEGAVKSNYKRNTSAYGLDRKTDDSWTGRSVFFFFFFFFLFKKRGEVFLFK